MDQFLYIILLFAVYVILPVIPSCLIYKIFPKGSVGVSGVLQSLKINATGAFAAYVIVCLIGLPIIRTGLKIIEGMNHQSWEVTADVNFVNKDHLPLEYVDVKTISDSLQITIKPDKKYINDREISFMVPKFEERMNVLMNVDGFIPQSKTFDENVTIDYRKNLIDLGEITFIQDEQKEKNYLSEAEPFDLANLDLEGSYE